MTNNDQEEAAGAFMIMAYTLLFGVMFGPGVVDYAKEQISAHNRKQAAQEKQDSIQLIIQDSLDEKVEQLSKITQHSVAQNGLGQTLGNLIKEGAGRARQIYYNDNFYERQKRNGGKPQRPYSSEVTISRRDVGDDLIMWTDDSSWRYSSDDSCMTIKHRKDEKNNYKRPFEDPCHTYIESTNLEIKVCHDGAGTGWSEYGVRTDFSQDSLPKYSFKEDAIGFTADCRCENGVLTFSEPYQFSTDRLSYAHTVRTLIGMVEKINEVERK